MRILLLGAGMMARAIAYSLATKDEVDSIVVADREAGCAETIARFVGDRRVVPVALDVEDAPALRRTLAGSAVVISAVPYFYNLKLAKAALEAGAHFCDLGGNNSIVRAELALDGEAKTRGVPVLASDRPSLSEIVADSAYTVNPRDPRGVARALARLIGDKALAADLRRRGLAHATRFSWDATARQVLAILRQVGQP